MKIHFAIQPLIIEMLNDARRGMSTLGMIEMYMNQLEHLKQELKLKDPAPIQRDLEDQIKEEKENI